MLDAPEQTKMIRGEVMGEAGGKADCATIFSERGMDFPYDDLTAEGIYVMVPVEITNVADELQMLTGSVLKVVDSAGQEHVAAGRLKHEAYVWATERWMGVVHELAPAVFNAEEMREGPLIFDVLEGATGLMLSIKGTDDAIGLGF